MGKKQKDFAPPISVLSKQPCKLCLKKGSYCRYHATENGERKEDKPPKQKKERTFFCELCAKSFWNDNQLSKHREGHKKDKPRNGKRKRVEPSSQRQEKKFPRHPAKGKRCSQRCTESVHYSASEVSESSSESEEEEPVIANMITPIKPAKKDAPLAASWAGNSSTSVTPVVKPLSKKARLLQQFKQSSKPNPLPKKPDSVPVTTSAPPNTAKKSSSPTKEPLSRPGMLKNSDAKPKPQSMHSHKPTHATKSPTKEGMGGRHEPSASGNRNQPVAGHSYLTVEALQKIPKDHRGANTLPSHVRYTDTSYRNSNPSRGEQSQGFQPPPPPPPPPTGSGPLQTNYCICGKDGVAFCSICQLQFYCGPECQRMDWGRHSQICGKQTNTNHTGDRPENTQKRPNQHSIVDDHRQQPQRASTSQTQPVQPFQASQPPPPAPQPVLENPAFDPISSDESLVEVQLVETLKPEKKLPGDLSANQPRAEKRPSTHHVGDDPRRTEVKRERCQLCNSMDHIAKNCSQYITKKKAPARPSNHRSDRHRREPDYGRSRGSYDSKASSDKIDRHASDSSRDRRRAVGDGNDYHHRDSPSKRKIRDGSYGGSDYSRGRSMSPLKRPHGTSRQGSLSGHRFEGSLTTNGKLPHISSTNRPEDLSTAISDISDD